eukprot:m.15870 g.15870  ORF g.15870 m.15870 type:complete len:143 (-) comp6821_c0_seq1:226-654(-)
MSEEKCEGLATGLVKIGNAQVEASAVKNLIVYTMAMFTVPFIAFFTTKLITESLEWPRNKVQTLSTLAAVICVNVIIFLFVRIGWREMKQEEALLKAQAQAQTEEEAKETEEVKPEGQDKGDGAQRQQEATSVPATESKKSK